MRAMQYLDPAIRLSRDFRLREFVRSDTADAHGIQIQVIAQSPVHHALVSLVERVLQPLRREIGYAIQVTSGYRPAHVNELVGSTPGSQHTRGEAADIVVPPPLDVVPFSPLELAREIVALDLPFDQLIHEFGRWVHVSHSHRHRRECLTAYTDADGRTQYAPGLHEIEALL